MNRIYSEEIHNKIESFFGTVIPVVPGNVTPLSAYSLPMPSRSERVKKRLESTILALVSEDTG